MTIRHALVLAAMLVLPGGTITAQQAAPTGGQGAAMPLLMVDQEELFLRSAFGARIRADIARRLDDLAEENRRIESELVAEEQALTDRRETLTPETFRPLAVAFDERVTSVRAAQDAKAAAIETASDQAQQSFFARVARILGQIMRDRGAVAIVDGRAVLLSVDAMDITQEAIARIDAEIGDGLSADGAADDPDPTGEDTGPGPDTVPPQGGTDTGSEAGGDGPPDPNVGTSTGSARP